MNTQLLPASLITQADFRPYGQLIQASADGKEYDREDAQLQLQNGIPRFYIMRLKGRGKTFDRITRHRQCTQCLGSLEGKEWLIAVAPPSEADKPDPDEIRAFRIPGNCFIKLEVGTWHAGPYFESDPSELGEANRIDFYNLELSDTNITDHDTCNLQHAYGIQFEIT